MEPSGGEPLDLTARYAPEYWLLWLETARTEMRNTVKRFRALVVVAVMAASTLTFVPSTPASATTWSCGSSHSHNWGIVLHSIKNRYWTGTFIAEPWYQYDYFNLTGKYKGTTYCR